MNIHLGIVTLVILFYVAFQPVQTQAAYDDSGDLALGATVIADSVFQNDPAYSAAYAIDGDDSTRWISDLNPGTHWVQLDLGEVKQINQVQVNWGAAYGLNYTVQTSIDEINWQTAVTMTGNTNVGLIVHSFNTISARYVQLNCTVSADNTGISVYEFRVYCGNLAQNKNVTVDSTFSTGYEGYKAVDGDASTRWASAPNAGIHWISVDLGESKLVRQVQINWERGSGEDYTIQLSTNGTTWTIHAAIIGNTASGWVNQCFDAAPARYVKINCTKATLGANISIYELYVGVEDSSAVVNFSTKTGISTPYFIGGNQFVSHDLASVINPQFTNVGFNRIRATVHFEDIIPTNLCASLADYKNNLNNIQNPTNWDFDSLYGIDDATNYGFKVLLVFAYTPSWLSYDTNWNGVPKDWAVWEDLCNKVYAKYKHEIGWVEPWNETEYFLDLTGSSYTNPESFQADLYYYTAQGVRAAGGTNASIGGFALADNDFLAAKSTLQYMISRYGPSWVNANFNFYSSHQYWGDAAELDTLSIHHVLQGLGLNGNIPIFLDEWNYPYWWPDTGEYTGQQAIGFVGKCLAKILKRGVAADYYALTQLYDPDSLSLYPQVASFRIAAIGLKLNHGSNIVCQTIDSYIDSVAAINPDGNPVVYLANYNDMSKRVYLSMNGITNTFISGLIYVGSISNNGSNVYESFSMAVTNASAVLTLDMNSNSVAGVVLNGGSIITNNVTNEITSNIAITSSQSVSSTYPGYDAYKAVDGLEKISDRGEWASDVELNPWIQLSWPTSMNVSKVLLLDRPNLTDAVNSGVLYFSDGSNIPVPFISNDGSPVVVMFPTKSITWVKFQVTGGSGLNVGLSEFKVYGSLVPFTSSSSPPTEVPTLDIGTLGDQVAITWDPKSTGWVLQSANTLVGGNWKPISGVVTNSYMFRAAPNGSMFFRLVW